MIELAFEALLLVVTVVVLVLVVFAKFMFGLFVIDVVVIEQVVVYKSAGKSLILWVNICCFMLPLVENPRSQ